MKKVLSLLLCLVVVLSTLSVISCSSKHPIEKIGDRMIAEKNFKMVMTMYDIPKYGTVTLTMEFDRNIAHVSASDEEFYLEEIDDKTFTYAKSSYEQEWKKYPNSSPNEDYYSADFANPFFDSEKYKEIEGEENTYKQKESVKFDDFENVIITINDDESCAIRGIMSSTDIEFKIVISKIGEIDLTLPEVG